MSSFPLPFSLGLSINKTGVIPQVRELENLWDSCFRKTSQFISRGTALYSDLTGREYVESMLHDRWSIDSNYPAPTSMALTMEGVYQFSPRGGCCNTEEDYEQLGVEMGWAMLLYLDAVPVNKTAVF